MSASRQFYTSIASGTEELNNNQYVKAIEFYTLAIQLEPNITPTQDRAQAYFLRATAYDRLNCSNESNNLHDDMESDAAISDYSAAYKLDKSYILRIPDQQSDTQQHSIATRQTQNNERKIAGNNNEQQSLSKRFITKGNDLLNNNNHGDSIKCYLLALNCNNHEVDFSTFASIKANLLTCLEKLIIENDEHLISAATKIIEFIEKTKIDDKSLTLKLRWVRCHAYMRHYFSNRSSLHLSDDMKKSNIDFEAIVRLECDEPELRYTYSILDHCFKEIHRYTHEINANNINLSINNLCFKIRSLMRILMSERKTKKTDIDLESYFSIFRNLFHDDSQYSPMCNKNTQLAFKLFMKYFKSITTNSAPTLANILTLNDLITIATVSEFIFQRDTEINNISISKDENTLLQDLSLLNKSVAAYIILESYHPCFSAAIKSKMLIANNTIKTLEEKILSNQEQNLANVLYSYEQSFIKDDMQACHTAYIAILELLHSFKQDKANKGITLKEAFRTSGTSLTLAEAGTTNNILCYSQLKELEKNTRKILNKLATGHLLLDNDNVRNDHVLSLIISNLHANKILAHCSEIASQKPNRAIEGYNILLSAELVRYVNSADIKLKIEQLLTPINLSPCSSTASSDDEQKSSSDPTINPTIPLNLSVSLSSSVENLTLNKSPQQHKSKTKKQLKAKKALLSHIKPHSNTDNTSAEPASTSIEPLSDTASSTPRTLGMATKPFYIQVPEFVQSMMKALKSSNEIGAKLTFLDGGYVRDQIRRKYGLKRDQKHIDYDLATGASEQTIRDIFANATIKKKPLLPEQNCFLYEITFTDGNTIELCQRAAFMNANKDIDIDHVLNLDAQSRDFTINTFYADESGIVNNPLNIGREIFNTPYLQTIIDETESFKQDPIRILRAHYLTTSLGFITLSPNMLAAITANLSRLNSFINAEVHPTQLFDNKYKINTWLLKLFCVGDAVSNFRLLEKTGALVTLFPQLALSLNNSDSKSRLLALLEKIKLYDQNSKDKHLTLNYVFALFIKCIQIHTNKASTDIIQSNPLFARNFANWSPGACLNLVNSEWDIHVIKKPKATSRSKSLPLHVNQQPHTFFAHSHSTEAPAINQATSVMSNSKL